MHYMHWSNVFIFIMFFACTSLRQNVTKIFWNRRNALFTLYINEWELANPACGQNKVFGDSMTVIHLHAVISVCVMLAALPSSPFFCLPPMPPEGATTVPPPRHKPDALESRQGERGTVVCMFKYVFMWRHWICVVTYCVPHTGIQNKGDGFWTVPVKICPIQVKSAMRPACVLPEQRWSHRLNTGEAVERYVHPNKYLYY